MIGNLMRWLYRRQMRDRTHDASMGHPRYMELCRCLRDGRWGEFQAEFALLPRDERHVILSGLAEDSIVDPLGTWTGHETPTGLLIRGTALISQAWRARTRLRAKYVGADGAKRFLEYLNQSADHLLAAHQAAPEDPEPLARLIRALMGLGADRNEIYKCHERLLATGQHHLAGGFHMIEALAPKWGGDEPELLSFAHTQANADPRNRSLIAYAHIESWVSASDDPEMARSYFERHYVGDEITQAYEADPLRSGFDYFALMARGMYALCFFKLGDQVRAQRELSAIENRYATKPWAYLDGIESAAVNAARAWAGLPALPG